MRSREPGPPDRAHLLRRRRAGGDVQEALELTGKRMLGAVLVAGRRSHRHELAVRPELAGPLPPARARSAGASETVSSDASSAAASAAVSSAVRCSGVRLSMTAAADSTNQGGTGSPARCARARARALPPACGESMASRRAENPARSPPQPERAAARRRARGTSPASTRRTSARSTCRCRASAGGRGARPRRRRRSHEHREQHEHRQRPCRCAPPPATRRQAVSSTATSHARTRAVACPRARCRSRRRALRRPARASCVRSRSPCRSGS